MADVYGVFMSIYFKILDQIIFRTLIQIQQLIAVFIESYIYHYVAAVPFYPFKLLHIKLSILQDKTTLTRICLIQCSNQVKICDLLTPIISNPRCDFSSIYGLICIYLGHVLFMCLQLLMTGRGLLVFLVLPFMLFILQESAISSLREWLSDPAIGSNPILRTIAGIIYMHEQDYNEALKHTNAGGTMEL